MTTPNENPAEEGLRDKPEISQGPSVVASKPTTRGQRLVRTPSLEEHEFMAVHAIPKLDGVGDDRTLQHLADNFWNLCLWEKQRADILDTKASYLLGLSTLAGAVVAFGGQPSTGGALIARGVTLLLFVLAVSAALITLLTQKYGTFLDEDVFDALTAYKQPVGDLPPFEDKDQHRCYLRETILQRWLIYRWYADENDAKYRWLSAAQAIAFLAILSLLSAVIVITTRT